MDNPAELLPTTRKGVETLIDNSTNLAEAFAVHGALDYPNANPLEVAIAGYMLMVLALEDMHADEEEFLSAAQSTFGQSITTSAILMEDTDRVPGSDDRVRKALVESIIASLGIVEPEEAA